ncbi:MAG TPA: bifunctional riboflavin kinase/FAD synthetase [bacterium]|nr:bifunctional riboflavin kinase/FAD synthetase [bacterium]
MHVYHSPDEVPDPEGMNVALTMGFFDGVHIGHRKILEKLGRYYDPGVQITGLVTMDPHPASVLDPENAPKLITTLKEKIDIFSSFNLSYVLILPFSGDVSQMPAKQFLQEVLVEKLKVKKMIVGYDTRFGRNRDGDVRLLEKEGARIGFGVETVQAVKLGSSGPVSSTAIRNALMNGKPEEAASMLGSNYIIRGSVVKGFGLGSRLGIPTANVEIDPEKLVPGHGVYAAYCRIGNRKLKSAVNIGLRPTIPQKSPKPVIEAHLLDFKDDVYGKDIEVEFVNFIRPERKYSDAKALVGQMRKDIELAENKL